MPRLRGGKISHTKMALYQRRRYWYTKLRADGVAEEDLYREFRKVLSRSAQIRYYRRHREECKASHNEYAARHRQYYRRKAAEHYDREHADNRRDRDRLITII